MTEGKEYTPPQSLSAEQLSALQCNCTAFAPDRVTRLAEVFKVDPEEQIAAVTALSNAVTSRGFPVAGDEQNLSAEKAGQVVNNTVHRAVAMLEPGAVRDYLMTPTSSTLMSDTDRLAFERACNTLDIDSAKQELYARMVGYSLQQQEQKNPATCASLRAEGNRDKNRAMIMMARVMQVLDEGGAIAPEHYQELAQAMEDYKMLELLPPRRRNQTRRWYVWNQHRRP